MACAALWAGAFACARPRAKATEPEGPRDASSPMAAESGTDLDAGDETAAWAERVCAERGAGGIVARAVPEVVVEDCYPKRQWSCERTVRIRVANCARFARDQVRVIEERPQPRGWELAQPVPAGAAAVVPVPTIATGPHRYRVVASAENHPEATDEVTVEVRDPALERARKEHCLDLGAGVLDAGAPPPPRDGLELKLTRTACYGRCPAYSVTLRTDGSVIYEGKSDVRLTGRVIDVVPPAVVATLLARFDRAAAEPPVRRDPGTHCVRATDVARTYVTLERNGVAQRMPAAGDCDPPHEGEMATEIDRVTRSERWVTGSAPCRANELW